MMVSAVFILYDLMMQARMCVVMSVALSARAPSVALETTAVSDRIRSNELNELFIDAGVSQDHLNSMTLEQKEYLFESSEIIDLVDEYHLDSLFDEHRRSLRCFARYELRLKANHL